MKNINITGKNIGSINNIAELCEVFNCNYDILEKDFYKYLDFLIDRSLVYDLYICALKIPCMSQEAKQKIEEAIIASGNLEYIYNFARDIEGADIDRLEEAIITTNDLNYIKSFYRNITHSEKLEYIIYSLEYFDLNEAITNIYGIDVEISNEKTKILS